MEEDPEERKRQFEELCRGWYVGTKEGKAALAGEIQNGKAKANAEALNELEEVRWKRLLEEGMKILEKKGQDVRKDNKSAEWKLAWGAWMKSQSAVPNRWLAQQLNMGSIPQCQQADVRLRPHTIRAMSAWTVAQCDT